MFLIDFIVGFAAIGIGIIAMVSIITFIVKFVFTTKIATFLLFIAMLGILVICFVGMAKDIMHIGKELRIDAVKQINKAFKRGRE